MARFGYCICLIIFLASGPVQALEQPTEIDRTLRIRQATTIADYHVVVPIELDSMGDETAIYFSVGFDPSKLSISNISSPAINPDISIGSGMPAGASLTVNADYVASGKIGIFIDSKYPFAPTPPTRQIITLRFVTAPTGFGTTPLVLHDKPAVRTISDAQGNIMVATYQNGHVSILLPAAPFDDGRGVWPMF